MGDEKEVEDDDEEAEGDDAEVEEAEGGEVSEKLSARGFEIPLITPALIKAARSCCRSLSANWFA